MDTTTANIVIAIVGTVFSVVGGLFVFFVKKNLSDSQLMRSDIQTIKLDCEILKRDIKHALDLRQGVENDHDNLVRLRSEFSSFRDQDGRDKKAFFDKTREADRRLAEVESRVKSNHG